MDIEESLKRLTEFAASWHGGDVIDDDSGLTGDDLESVIKWMEVAQAGPQ